MLIIFPKKEVLLLEQFHDTITSRLWELFIDKLDEKDVENKFFELVSLVMSNSNPTADDGVFSSLRGSRSKISINEEENGPPITGWINPLSKEGEKYAAFLQVFCVFFKFPCEVYLNPKESTGEIPLQSWFRYVLYPSLSFNEDGSYINDKIALFSDLPTSYILTTYTDEPETWLLESTYAVYDLDNINLDHVEDTLYARYQLEHIVVTGSCMDITKKEHPRGLQFVLTSEEDRKDTLVMANLGYFQLKANPNVFKLNLAQGRHDELFEFNGISYENKWSYRGEPTKYEDIKSLKNIPVHVTHFDGPFLKLQLNRKEGKENEDLMTAEKRDGIWSKMTNSFFGKKKKNDDSNNNNEDKETLNIFSVASGHLYERLLKIMMRSVMRSTVKSNVKFWILKNYLSPQFKEFIPHMASKYGFEVEFVTYKWPTWLHKQTNKIRIIWAYKVLFLDVLFPIDVQKIIYVDSDQTTRADLSELWNIDMKGKAVAYTPFCDDKPEMDGYAFWKGGYWKNHLKGKSYHISALYVVDIETFRRIYAGDQYRVIYDNLSQDPNSLSNLDQDLPNFAQHMIPIHSLPMEWLWCETWCNQEKKKFVKTIDLCNNPQTKEHKVDQARRIMNVNNDWDFNWTDLDNEISAFTKEIEEEYGIYSK